MFGDVGSARTKARICKVVDYCNLKPHLRKTDSYYFAATSAKRNVAFSLSKYKNYMHRPAKTETLLQIKNSLFKQNFIEQLPVSKTTESALKQWL